MEELILKKIKFEENLVNLINASELPPMIMTPILKEYLVKIQTLEQQQYQQALQENAKKTKTKKEKEGK